MMYTSGTKQYPPYGWGYTHICCRSLITTPTMANEKNTSFSLSFFFTRGQLQLGQGWQALTPSTISPQLWGSWWVLVSLINFDKSVLIGSPLKSYLQVPSIFSVNLEIFPVPISEICNYLMSKTDLKILWQISIYSVSFKSGN